MFNPEKRAELLRPKMMKDGKYLIARIKGSGEEFKEVEKKIVYNDYFKFKWYLKPRISSLSLKDIWSPKLLGLSENFWSLPLKKVKIIKWQNPPYCAAYRLKVDPRKYSKSFTIQMAGCNYDCNFCYVPKELNAANLSYAKYFSAKEIIENFLNARKEFDDEPLNIVRITGGEPTIVPEIILEIYEEIEKGEIDGSYIWIDTNLSTKKYLEKIESDLKNVMKKINVGVIGCFKGVSKKDFSLITGSKQKFYEKQFETVKMFLNLGSDFYLYLPALVYEDNIEQKIRNFIEKLQKLNKNLPLRVEVDPIIEYSAAKKNMEDKIKMGRPLPKTDQKIFFDLWYNKLLPEFYSKEMLNKFCCEIPM